MLQKDDLAFEVRHLVTEFPLLREAQTLLSLGNRVSLSKVWRTELNNVPHPVVTLKTSTATCLLYSMTSRCGQGQLYLTAFLHPDVTVFVT
jgi:hypothetical protein